MYARITAMRHALLCFLAACLSVPAAAQTEQARTYEARVFEDQSGDRLQYRLFRPADYDLSERYPLVVYLHGGGGRGDDNLKQLVGGNAYGTGLFSSDKVQQKHPSFVLAPQTSSATAADGWGGLNRPPRDSWDRTKTNAEFLPDPAGEPIDLLVRLIDSLNAEFSLDANRIYVTGQSMGGYGSWGLITRYPYLFAAAAPICGGGDPLAAKRIEIPIWAFHGADDKVVPVQQSRAMIEALKANAAKPRYTEFPGVGHNSWEKAYSNPELVEWLFAQRRP